jgi:tetratricopeptide (TPR) repeat protein
MMTHPITQERVANMELVIRSLNKTVSGVEASDPLKKIQLILRAQRREGDAVLAEYENLARQKPEDAEALHLLGFAQQLKGQLTQAQQSYEKARRLRPNDASLQRDLGRLYTKTGDFASAHAAFDRALALEPQEPLDYLFLGELYEKEGDFRSAAGAYLNAGNLSPLWDKPPHQLGLVYGKLDRLGDGYYYLGKSLVLEDEDEKAIADYEKAIKILGEKSPRAQLIREELKVLQARKK